MLHARVRTACKIYTRRSRIGRICRCAGEAAAAGSSVARLSLNSARHEPLDRPHRCRADRSLTARGTLRLGERIAPWPLSHPAPHVPAAESIWSPACSRPQRGQSDPARAAAVVVARRSPRQPVAQAAGPARTTTIAGTRSDGRGRRAALRPRRSAPAWHRCSRATPGRGTAIVLLHAFPLHSRMWEPQLDGLAERVPRGRARSRRLRPVVGSRCELLARRPARRARDSRSTICEIDEMVLVGLSMGGYVAFPLLERLGDRVRGLVLAHTRATRGRRDDRRRTGIVSRPRSCATASTSRRAS